MLLDYDRTLASLVADLKPPRSVSSPRVFVVLYGAPCTGKTTLGKELSRQLNAYRISTDLLRAKFVSAHLPEEQRYDRHVNVQLFELLARYASSALTKGISVVCEALLIDPSRIDRLLMVAAETSTMAHIFFLKAPLGELERRLILREQRGVNSEGLPEAKMEISVLHRLNLLCRPHPGTFYTFDTYLAPSSEIVREIVKIVRPAQKLTEGG
jgi:predicted kinase